MKIVLITKEKLVKLFFLMSLFSGVAMSTEIDIETKKLIEKTLKQKLDVEAKDIHYIEINKINWPSSALGCALKGQYYLPVITPGFRVKIKAQKQTYILHTSSQQAIICDDKKSVSQSRPKNMSEETTKKITAIQLSRQLLLKNQPSNTKRVKLISVKQQNWKQIKSECSNQEIFDESNYGYLIGIEYLGKKKWFYSDGDKVVVCENIE